MNKLYNYTRSATLVIYSTLVTKLFGIFYFVNLTRLGP